MSRFINQLTVRSKISASLLLLASFLALSGSDIPFYGKLRPFHFGIPLGILGAALMWPDFENLKKSIKFLILVGVFCLIQLLWVGNMHRYKCYLVLLLIGAAFYFIGFIVHNCSKNLPIWTYFVLVTFWLAVGVLKDVFHVHDSFAPEGAAFGNLNDMAAALVILVLIQYLQSEHLNSLLVFLAWGYSTYFCRRAAITGLVVFLILDLWDRKAAPEKLRLGALYSLIALLSFAMRWNHLRRFWELADPATSNSVNIATSSFNLRLDLLSQMFETMKASPWWQWVIGRGLGQLSLNVPYWHTHSASPHLFWLEMYIYFGIPWLICLAWLFYKSDWKAKAALITIGIVGSAMSSMIYFTPFYLLMGLMAARVESSG